MKDLYTDLLEIIEPYLSDFTGYDEKEQAFNIVLAVKELLSEFSTENERLRFCLDTQRIDDTNQYLEKVNIERKNYKLKSTLQKVKRYIAKICKEECGYVQKKRCPDCDCRYGAILDLITKTE